MSTSEGLTSGLHIMNSQQFSDEDIDSDLASLSSSPIGNNENGKPSLEAVSRTTSALTAGLSAFHPSRTATDLPDEFRDEKDDLPEDKIGEGDDGDAHNSSDDDNIDSAILANITAAATKRNLTHAAARHVDPDSAHGIVGETLSHPEMLGRIMKTLRPSAIDKPHVVPSLPILERKVAKLHTNKNKRLAVPVPEVVSARLERSAAYKKTNIEMTEKWQDTILHNRRAEQLSFPLDDPQLFTTTTALSSRPPSRRHGASEHELEIEQILKEAGVDSNGHVERTENAVIGDAVLQGKVSEEEVLRRRRELARMRSLAFHYDQKMKRIKKIKSKKYRRIMKKERERLAAEGDAGGDDAEQEEALAAERRRVEERVTLRHKNTSKWIRRQLQRGEAKKDTETRAAIEEQLRVHEELKQRQQKEVGNGNSDDDDDSENSDGDGMSDERQLDLLRSELQDEDPENNPASEEKGVMGLRFMKAAKERKRQEALAMLDSAQTEPDVRYDNYVTDSVVGPGSPHTVRNEPESASDGEQDNGGLEESMKEQEVGQLERRIRKEYDEAAASGIIRGKADGTIDVDTAASIIRSTNKMATTFTTRLDGRLTTDENNPWLKGVVFESRQAGGEGKVDKNLGTTPSAKKVEKKSKKITPSVPKQGVDHTKTIAQKSDQPGVTDGLKRARSPSRPQAKAIETKEKQQNSDNLEVKRGKKRRKKNTGSKNFENTASSENKQIENEPPKEVQPLNNREASSGLKENQTSSDVKIDNHLGRADADDLKKMQNIAQAFAGAGGADVEEFEAAKQAEIQEGLPTAKSLHAEVLPGWGQWHGAGMTEDAKKRVNETPFARAARERLAAARKNAIHSRSDRDMRNVILEQKRYDTATKLTIGFVPYPFRNREQWERELSRPLCRELVSNKAFRAGVERRIESKLGKVINPLDAPMPDPNNKSEQNVLVSRGNGKKAVIDLRKRKATHRVNARRDFLS